MKLRTLVVIPAHNEAESIGSVISDIKSKLKGADILIINDFSTDNTLDIVRSHKGVKCINNVFNLGYAYSVQTGIKYAEKHGYDYVIQMDADGQHLASEAKKLLDAAIDKKADIALGCRYYKGSDYKCPFFRRFGTILFERIIRLFTGKKIKDPLTGLQCLNKRVIAYYAKPGVYPEYPDAGLIIEMIIRKHKIIEVPVVMKKRETGESMHSGFLKPIKYMVTQFYACVMIFIKFIGRKYE